MRRRLGIFPALAAIGIGALTGCSHEQSGDASLRTYALGERVPLGRLVYTAFDGKWLTQLGSGTDARLPQNRFYLLRIAITNSGSGDATIPALMLVDDAGNTVPELSNGEGAPNWLGYLRQAHAAETVSGNILFDASPKHYKLKITDENGDRAAYIDIPLSFDADAPETTAPAAALPDPTAIPSAAQAPAGSPRSASPQPRGKKQ